MHGAAGLWGVLAVGLFGAPPTGARGGVDAQQEPGVLTAAARELGAQAPARHHRRVDLAVSAAAFAAIRRAIGRA